MLKLASFRVKLVNFPSEKGRFSFLLRSLHFGSNRLRYNIQSQFDTPRWLAFQMLIALLKLVDSTSLHLRNSRGILVLHLRSYLLDGRKVHIRNQGRIEHIYSGGPVWSWRLERARRATMGGSMGLYPVFPKSALSA